MRTAVEGLMAARKGELMNNRRYGLDWDDLVMFGVVLFAALLGAGDVIFRFSSNHDLELKEALMVLVLGTMAALLVRFGATLKSLHESSSDLSEKVDPVGMTLERLDESSKDISAKVNAIADSMAGRTLVLALTDRSEQYQQGADVLNDIHCGPIFLMQRSSSLILGWEERSEHQFYENLMLRIRETDFYPVVSLEGIQTHLDLQRKRFKHTAEAFAHLRRDEDDTIYVLGEEGATPHQLRRPKSADYKQGRILLIGRGGKNAAYADAIIVFDVGSSQFSLHLRGTDLHEYLKDCKVFYESGCDPVTAEQLRKEVPELRDLPIQSLRPARQGKDG
jgi:hypothetical protein